jgi:hypothetical protein
MTKKTASVVPVSLRVMDKGAVGWMVSYAKKNYWRVAAHFDFDDLLQEGRECYYYVLAHYPNVTDRPHIMSLFQRTFFSRIQDLANKKTKQIDQCEGDLTYDNELYIAVPELATLTALLSQAPPAIKKVLELFTTEAGCKRLRSELRIDRSGHKETLNERLCRLAGLDPEAHDMVETFQNYFS